MSTKKPFAVLWSGIATPAVRASPTIPKKEAFFIDASAWMWAHSQTGVSTSEEMIQDMETWSNQLLLQYPRCAYAAWVLDSLGAKKKKQRQLHRMLQSPTQQRASFSTTVTPTWDVKPVKEFQLPNVIRLTNDVLASKTWIGKIAVVSHAQTEADDVIATLVGIAVKFPSRVRIVSPDKDFYQLLVDSSVEILPGFTLDESDAINANRFTKLFGGLKPECYCDYLGLTMDDAIPKGTAIKWLKQFGTLEEVVKNKELKQSAKFLAAKKIAMLDSHLSLRSAGDWESALKVR